MSNSSGGECIMNIKIHNVFIMYLSYNKSMNPNVSFVPIILVYFFIIPNINYWYYYKIERSFLYITMYKNYKNLYYII